MSKENRTKDQKEIGWEMKSATALAILDHLPTFVYLISPDNSIHYANRSFRNLFGDPEGKLCYQALHRRTTPCSSCPALRVRKTGRPERWEWEGPDERTYEIHCYPYGGPNGKERFLNIGMDITRCKRTEALFRESEEELQSLFENSLDAILLTAPDGRIFKANPAACRMFGRSEEEICRLGRDGVVDTSDPRLTTLMEERSRTGRWKGEINHKRKDGAIFPTELSTALFFDPSGKVRTSMVIRDISERKRIEKALQLSEQKFRNLAESTSDWILEMDEQGTITYASPQVKDMLGYLPEEILGTKPLDLCPQEEAKRLVPFVKQKMKTPESFSGLEGVNVHKDGHMVYLEASGAPVWGLDGSFRGYLCVYRDITERKQAERALREAHDELERRVEQRTREINQINENLRREIAERKQAETALRHSEELFRAIFETAQDLITIKDLAGRHVKVNPAMERAFGLPASEIIGLRAEDIVDSRSSKAISEYESRILAGETVEAERTIALKSGTFVFHSIGVPLKDPDGTIIGICSISRDITERKMVGTFPQGGTHGYRSGPMRTTLSAMNHAAASDVIVLVQGESGSGKDYAARRIHDLSSRAGGPFFSINCAALPHELAESELFGHEAGAFTGAAKRKKGLLELAEGGTLLLNEVGELSLSLQSKLLSFLDARSFLRVGGEKSITVNARLMAATHRDLEEEVEQGRFLRPLYYRLSVFSIHIPPLRKRAEDIPSIAKDLMAGLAREMQLNRIPVIEPLDVRALQRYHWPGNIRELRNVLERALIVCGEGPFRLSVPALEETTEQWSHTVRLSPGQTLRNVTDEVTQGLCMEALRRCQGSKTGAARMLGISRDSMYRHMKRFGLVSEPATHD